MYSQTTDIMQFADIFHYNVKIEVLEITRNTINKQMQQISVFQLGQNRRALRPSCPPWRPSCPSLRPSCPPLCPSCPYLMCVVL